MPLNIANETTPEDRGEDIPEEEVPEGLENDPQKPEEETEIITEEEVNKITNKDSKENGKGI